MPKANKQVVFFLSTYPSRECGLATFTQDIVKELLKSRSVVPKVIAIDNGEHTYGEEVYAHFSQQDRAAYAGTAEQINKTDASLVMIEHEYGIFGGPDGEYLLDFTEKLQVPYLLTCHTVLPNPSERQKDILTRLCKDSAGVVVMAKHSGKLLEELYGVEPDKITHIHHGVPSFFCLSSRKQLKKKEGLDGKTVISTFGFVGPGKGLEYGIEAVAKVAPAHPDICYLILGPTHPNIVRECGETYREQLMRQVQDLKMEQHVRFVDKYLHKNDIIHYLLLSDIYMTPYPGKDQAVSGTLAYAIGSGRAVVSTPYVYAQEMLADGRGLLADFCSADSLAQCLRTLLENPGKRAKMEQNAAKLGKSMTWPAVAKQYETLFQRYHQSLRVAG